MWSPSATLAGPAASANSPGRGTPDQGEVVQVGGFAVDPGDDVVGRVEAEGRLTHGDETAPFAAGQRQTLSTRGDPGAAAMGQDFAAVGGHDPHEFGFAGQPQAAGTVDEPAVAGRGDPARDSRSASVIASRTPVWVPPPSGAHRRAAPWAEVFQRVVAALPGGGPVGSPWRAGTGRRARPASFGDPGAAGVSP